jgi:glutamate formiminotransferase
VGARRPLVAINCVLISREVAVARRIARLMRERDGGMRGVRALGFFLPDAQRAQVSMNLTEIERTGVQDACLHVRELAQKLGTDVASVELVGLLPRAELDRCSDEFLTWSGVDATSTIEARISHGPRWLPGDAPAPA